jgi:FMN phosphatase YigB (HAD superfamily)
MEKYLVDGFSFKNIKAIIFDFDKTLYFSENLEQYYANFIKKTIMTLGNYTENEAVHLMEEWGFTGDKKTPSFAKVCTNFGISKESWDNYRVEQFFEFDYENADTVKNKTLQKLASYYPLFLVSNEVKGNLITKAEKLSINYTIFQKIYAPSKEELNTYPTKKQIYDTIIKSLNIKPNEVFSVGDRLLVDVQPLLELGGSGFVITHPSEIDDIAEELFKEIN